MSFSFPQHACCWDTSRSRTEVSQNLKSATDATRKGSNFFNDFGHLPLNSGSVQPQLKRSVFFFVAFCVPQKCCCLFGRRKRVFLCFLNCMVGAPTVARIGEQLSCQGFLVCTCSFPQQYSAVAAFWDNRLTHYFVFFVQCLFLCDELNKDTAKCDPSISRACHDAGHHDVNTIDAIPKDSSSSNHGSKIFFCGFRVIRICVSVTFIQLLLCILASLVPTNCEMVLESNIVQLCQEPRTMRQAMKTISSINARGMFRS